MINCDDYGPIGYYPLWMAPFHICSMGLYADFMTLRYGNGNPLAFLLKDTPVLYYLLLTAVSIGGMALVLAVTIWITALSKKREGIKEQSAKDGD